MIIRISDAPTTDAKPFHNELPSTRVPGPVYSISRIYGLIAKTLNCLYHLRLLSVGNFGK